jgi:ribonuclease BN (tRNA processing enzyme)
MKLTVLGSGSAFTTGGNFHSNFLLTSSTGKNLLIDCGSDARHSLAKRGMTNEDIDSTYISHFHADHSGGLEWLAFSSKFTPPFRKPRLLIHESLVEKIWDNQLSASLGPIGEESATLSTYFDVVPLKMNFAWEGISCHLVQTKHVKNSGEWVPSFGISLHLGSKKIFITTDTQFVPDYFEPYYEQSDLIFHDCETTHYASGVHANYQELVTLPQEIRAKIWLYHFNPGPLADATKDGFLGYLQPGQTFEFGT